MKSILTAALFAASVVSGYATAGYMQEYKATEASDKGHALAVGNFEGYGREVYCQNALRCVNTISSPYTSASLYEKAYDCYMNQRRLLRAAGYPLVDILLSHMVDQPYFLEGIQSAGKLGGVSSEFVSRVEEDLKRDRNQWMSLLSGEDFSKISLDNWLILANYEIKKCLEKDSYDSLIQLNQIIAGALQEKILPSLYSAGRPSPTQQQLDALDKLCHFIDGGDAQAKCYEAIVDLSNVGLSPYEFICEDAEGNEGICGGSLALDYSNQ